MKIAFIYLASGFAKRFGSNKLLVLWQGKPLYQAGFETLQKAKNELLAQGHDVKIIVTSQYAEILAWCQEHSAVAVENTHSLEGITASLKLGTRAAQDAQVLLFCAADQPFLQAGTIVKLVAVYLQSGKKIGCVVNGTRQGNPTLFASVYSQELLELKGDKGGKVLLQKHSEDVFQLPVAAEELRDIDFPTDLTQVEK